MIVWHRKIIPTKLVRQGMYAWTLICKELAKIKESEMAGLDEERPDGEDKKMAAPPGCANLPLDEKVLNKALMLLNLTMSENLIKIWIKKVKP